MTKFRITFFSRIFLSLLAIASPALAVAESYEEFSVRMEGGAATGNPRVVYRIGSDHQGSVYFQQDVLGRTSEKKILENVKISGITAYDPETHRKIATRMPSLKVDWVQSQNPPEMAQFMVQEVLRDGIPRKYAVLIGKDGSQFSIYMGTVERGAFDDTLRARLFYNPVTKETLAMVEMTRRGEKTLHLFGPARGTSPGLSPGAGLGNRGLPSGPIEVKNGILIFDGGKGDRPYFSLIKGEFISGPPGTDFTDVDIRENPRFEVRRPRIVPEIEDEQTKTLPDEPPTEKKSYSETLRYGEELKTKIKTEVIGQDPMVEQLVDTYVSVMTDGGKRPHKVVMVAGTTGVGKSYTAEVLGEKALSSPDKVLVIDMTAFQGNGQDTNAARWQLFGAASGYLGSDKSKGIIPDWLKKVGKGDGMIILNEIDKADPEVLKLFMEVFDTGQVRTGTGELFTLGRKLIVMTTNKGATEFFPPEQMKGIDRNALDRRIRAIPQNRLQEAFLKSGSYTNTKAVPREVIQRVDEWTLASPLLREEALRIAQLQAETYSREFSERTGSGTLKVSDSFIEKIVDASFDEANGAREVKRKVVSTLKQATRAFMLKNSESSFHLEIGASAPEYRPTEVKIQVSDGRSTLVMDGPRPISYNPMQDPEIRQRLKGMPSVLSERVIDQEEAVTKVTNAVRASAGTPGNKSPASIFLAGRTGTGKTELAKAVAQARYGGEDAIKIFNMGEVKSIEDLSNIFSPRKGTAGSDTVGPFEEMLKKYPEGAVFVFDEMSNAGGANRQLKEEIAKAFYSILDEGTWSSPSAEYRDLNKFTFIFTGNDGEKVFQGMESDDLLLSTWKSIAGDKTALRKILLDSGFPEAFLGRFKDIVFMKPPSFEAKAKIAKKLVNGWVAKFRASQPFEVRFSDDFEHKLAGLIYSSSEGARSIRNFIDTTLGSLAVQSTLDFDWDALAHSPGKITIDVESTSILNPFYWLRPNERKAILKIKAEQDGKLVYEGSADFTKDAKFMTQIRAIDAWGTAFHEAGHALLNDPKTSGKILEHLTIVPSGVSLGYARYVPKPGWLTNLDRTAIVRRISTLLAGTVAEEMIGRPRNTGPGSDVQQIRELLHETVVKGSLVKELDGALTDKEGNLVMSSKTQQIIDDYITKVMEDAQTFTRSELRRQWGSMVAVANALMKKGSISGNELQRILKDARSGKTPTSRMTPERIQIFMDRLSGKCARLLEAEI